MPFTKLESVVEVLKIFDDFDILHEDIWWRTDDKYAPVTMFVDCSDLFMWGCADCLELTEENLPRLRATVNEIREQFGDKGDHLRFAPLLFCARERKCRPQYAYYKRIPVDMHGLFNAVSDKPGYGFPNTHEISRMVN